jgi:hypothetical protein
MAVERGYFDDLAGALTGLAGVSIGGGGTATADPVRHDLFHFGDAHAPESADDDDRNLASVRRIVRTVLGQSEIDPARFWDRQGLGRGRLNRLM